MKKIVWRSYFLIILFLAGVTPLLYVYSHGNLSPKQLATGFLILVGCVFGLVVYRLSSVPTSQDQTSQVEGEQPNEAAKAIKKIRTAVVVLPLLLIAASWITRDQPLLPRLVGASMNILITFWLLSQLRRLKRNAK